MLDTLVFIGRFQPFHNGHEEVIRTALTKADTVVIVIGSCFAARNIRNPFTFEERSSMIRAVFPTDRIIIRGVSDYPYDDNKWINAIQRIVDLAVPNAANIGLIGHSKDSTSYYLNIFPNWKNHVEVANVEGINATDIRNMIYNYNPDWDRFVPQAVEKCIPSLPSELFEEFQMINRYKQSWKLAPFPPTFVTVDAVVVQSGHVLLVKRAAMPGKGLSALPGGFLNQDETMLDGAIRELKEETKIKVPVPVLKGSIKQSKTFDAPNRSTRGRTITQAFFIDLGVGELPKVKGSDDAEKAFWVPFNKIQQDQMFEDHYAILDFFLNIGV